MLPILQPDEKLREALTPHARDLGRAFQMTNFIRDISEDLDLGRQYIPEEVCARHNVVLSKKDSTQEGFAPMMEEMFEYTDKFYSSADIGISLLAPDVCHVISFNIEFGSVKIVEIINTIFLVKFSNGGSFHVINRSRVTMIELRSGTVDFIHEHAGEFAVTKNICVFECEGFALKLYIRYWFFDGLRQRGQ